MWGGGGERGGEAGEQQIRALGDPYFSFPSYPGGGSIKKSHSRQCRTPEQHLELVNVSKEQALKPLYLSCNLINSINSEAISACTESTGLISDNAE